MGEKNKEYERILQVRTNSDRLQFFSDAVFAIAMTLLVIDITVPTIAKSVSDAQLDGALWHAIASQWQSFLAYAISFWLIAINWVGHHRKFTLMRQIDGRVVTLNLCLLFFIAFVPYPTSLISEYAGSMPAIVLYASEVSIVSLLQWAIWAYSYRKGFLDERVDAGLYRYVTRGYFSVPLVFLLSIPVGYLFGGIWSMYFWILNWPISSLVGSFESKAKRAPEPVNRSRDSAS
jgi:uncharacterized membrane protein